MKSQNLFSYTKSVFPSVCFLLSQSQTLCSQQICLKVANTLHPFLQLLSNSGSFFEQSQGNIMKFEHFGWIHPWSLENLVPFSHRSWVNISSLVYRYTNYNQKFLFSWSEGSTWNIFGKENLNSYLLDWIIFGPWLQISIYKLFLFPRVFLGDSAAI